MERTPPSLGSGLVLLLLDLGLRVVSIGHCCEFFRGRCSGLRGVSSGMFESSDEMERRGDIGSSQALRLESPLRSLRQFVQRHQ